MNRLWFSILCFLMALPLMADGITEELALDTEKVNVSDDWWKYIIIALAGLLIAYLVIRLTLLVCRLVGTLVCIAVGVLGAYFAQALLNPWLTSVMPESVQQVTPVVSGIIGFLCCFLVAAGIMALIRKPAQASGGSRKGRKDKDGD